MTINIFKSRRILNLSRIANFDKYTFFSGSFSITDDTIDKNNLLLNFRLYKRIKQKNKYVNISLNQIVKLTPNFTIIDEHKIIIPPLLKEITKNINRFDKYIIGIEDMRIFNYNGIIKIIGTGQHNNGETKIVTGNYDYETNEINDFNYINVQFNYQQVEKNWVYFKNDTDELKIIYKWFPLQICQIQDNNLILTNEIQMPMFFSNARGSTCGVEYNDEIWFICHTNENSSYFHFFVIFDKNMNLKRYSNKFKFEGRKIEFCIGFKIIQKNIIICYSLNDIISKLALYNFCRLKELSWTFIEE